MSETTLAPRRLAHWQIAAALLVGGLLYYLAGNDVNPLRAMVVVGAMLASSLPFVNGGLAAAFDWLRKPTPATVHKLAIVLGALGAFYLLVTATFQERALVPKVDDECSYYIGAQMMAHGRLWMHAHPMADFFESVLMIVKPVYCSIYFPGTALFFAPSVWLNWPAYIFPLILSGALIAMLYRVVTEVLDGVAGLLAVFWILGLREFRTLSVMIMSHLVMLFLALLMIWAWLQWRKHHRARWAIVLGIFSGWAAITRPADAVAYALPIGIAMLFDLSRQSRRQLLVTAGALLAGAAPFLAVQVVFDIGVTGKPLLTPYTLSLQQDQPGAEFGFHRFDAAAHPATTNYVKLAYFDWTRIYIEQHRFPQVLLRWFFADSDLGGIHNAFLKIIADNTLPSAALLILVPLGLMSIRSQLFAVVIGVFFAFCLIYFFNPFFLEHYPLVITPAICVCALLGARAVVGQRFARRLSVPVTIGILALSVTALWEFKSLSLHDDMSLAKGRDGMLESSKIAALNLQLASEVGSGRVLVLFKQRTASFFEEPVYNMETADIDSCQIIRAHDLGDRNIEIIRYYAERQPDRVVYMGDASIPNTERIGTAAEALAKLQRGEPLQSTPIRSTKH